ncbi:DNA-binding transcriptional regulator, MarR family [Tistlia consotensis]|uniref:DNA-binding transcriptional regulator, MarR family n=1 Tax=Tistlia consotensis USBA 355 TaxID=560819 RepID=A0A1Y6BC86_9PROT|nr:MarR family transcriptional regulator [Tistlia consotensis]SMF02045.1 DNA-binding transcriptional regulator, MarR family [Tistlia consotensis USBA 355]SNS26240.1 DNA-binding transcriptional regulator, MarR family [Tistlia consotensis]
MHDDLTANLLGALATALSDRSQQGFEPLSPSSAAALLTLRHHGPLATTALAAILNLSQPAATRLLDRLEAEGLVARKAEAAGRSVPLALTAAGRRRAERLQAARLAASRRALEALSTAERGTLHKLLAKALGGLTEDRSQARHLCRFCDHGLCDGPACPVGSAAGEKERRDAAGA